MHFLLRHDYQYSKEQEKEKIGNGHEIPEVNAGICTFLEIRVMSVGKNRQSPDRRFFGKRFPQIHT
jgi:hypothetical protein